MKARKSSPGWLALGFPRVGYGDHLESHRPGKSSTTEADDRSSFLDRIKRWIPFRILASPSSSSSSVRKVAVAWKARRNRSHLASTRARKGTPRD